MPAAQEGVGASRYAIRVSPVSVSPRESEAQRSPPGRLGRKELAWAALLLLGTVLLYGRVGDFDFLVYDDGLYIGQNPVVLQGLSWKGLAWAVTSAEYACNWHPVTWAAHMLDVSLFGVTDPAGHHLMSAAIHALNGALLFLVLHSLTGARWPSLIVAVLFAWHPLRVESVAWVAERKDLLSGLLFLLTLQVYAGWVRDRRTTRFVLLLAVFAMGLMAKPVLVPLPALLLLIDRWPLARPESWRALVAEKLPLFGMSFLSGVMTIRSQALGGCTEYIHEGVPLLDRLGNAAIGTLRYIGKTLVPVDLAVFYPHPAVVDPGGGGAWSALAAALLLAALSIGAFRVRSRAPAVAVGWFWFLGMLLPVSGAVQVGGQAIADRYTYLSTIGLGIAIVWGLRAVAEGKPGAKKPLIVLAVAGSLAAAWLTWRQLPVWANSRSLFEHALAVTDRNYVAHSNLGLLDGYAAQLALSEGRPEGQALLASAMRHYRESVRILPSFYDGHVNLGWLLYLGGSYAAAVAELETAHEIRPDLADPLWKLGLARAQLGEWDEAIANLERAHALTPENTAIEEALRYARSQRALDP